VSYGRAVSQIEITMVCLQLKNTSAAPHGVTNIIMYVCMYIYIYAHINVSKAINPPYGLMVGIPAPKMGIADFPPCGRRLTTPQQGAPPRYALGGWGRKGMM
jgi:hypothetical protein